MTLRALPLMLAGTALVAGLAHGQEGAQVVPGDGARVEVPSGQEVTVQDVILNAPGPEGTTLRFRFVAPGIAEGGGVDFETAAADMLALCEGYALPRLSDFGAAPAQVVISLSAEPVAFGVTAPDVAQFFESYSIVDGGCQWEMF
ncbi:MAG: hypothetical protein RL216_3279 [Pseudomonadota bacterium]|jgi:hypothetical protein